MASASEAEIKRVRIQQEQPISTNKIIYRVDGEASAHNVLKTRRERCDPFSAHHQWLVYIVEHEIVILDNRMQVPGR